MKKTSPNSLAIIPARGGSKRLPRKNILKLGGHPLISYTIKAAQESSHLTDYLVSSDDKEIIDIARSYGAPVPFVRPAELATDTIRNSDVIIHALEFMEAKNGLQYDIVVLLQPTAPIRKSGHIDEAIMRLWESELDTLASVKGPYQKRDPILKRIDHDGLLVPYCKKDDLDPREPFYVYNAALYAVKRDYLLKNRIWVSDKQEYLLMDKYHSTDVDEMSDFITAEAYLSYLESNKKEK